MTDHAPARPIGWASGGRALDLHPPVSVVVPTYNEAGNAASPLQRLH